MRCSSCLQKVQLSAVSIAEKKVPKNDGNKIICILTKHLAKSNTDKMTRLKTNVNGCIYINNSASPIVLYIDLIKARVPNHSIKQLVHICGADTIIYAHICHSRQPCVSSCVRVCLGVLVCNRILY